MWYWIKNKQGLTLIEVLVVVAIVAIIVLLMAVGPGFLGTDRIKNTSKELLSDLQWARQAAMTQGPGGTVPNLRGFGIRFESTNRYWIFRFNETNPPNFIYDSAAEEASISDGEVAPREKAIYSTVQLKINGGGVLIDPANDVLIFDRNGTPRRANWSFAQMTIVIINPTNLEADRKCVTVSFNRIREGAWDGANCTEQ